MHRVPTVADRSSTTTAGSSFITRSFLLGWSMDNAMDTILSGNMGISLHTTVSYSIVSYCKVMFTPLAWLARQWTSTPWLSHSWPRAYHSAHLPSIPRSQPRNCGAVEPALYSLEDLGLNIVNKQHIDPAHQQQHHDVLDCKQNQAPMITWPPWKTGKAKNVQKKYKNSNLSHNFTIWG